MRRERRLKLGICCPVRPGFRSTPYEDQVSRTAKRHHDRQTAITQAFDRDQSWLPFREYRFVSLAMFDIDRSFRATLTRDRYNHPKKDVSVLPRAERDFAADRASNFTEQVERP